MALFVSCANSTPTASPDLGIDDIEAAVEAVRQQLGSEPAFFEINSTAEGVNLFIAVTRSENTGEPDAVIQGRYTRVDGLVLSAEQLDASGPTFIATDLRLMPDRLVSKVVEELKNSKPLMFVLTAVITSTGTVQAESPVVRRIIMESERGGRLGVFVDQEGTIYGTEILNSTG
jgi:hypothetical protein